MNNYNKNKLLKNVKNKNFYMRKKIIVDKEYNINCINMIKYNVKEYLRKKNIID